MTVDIKEVAARFKAHHPQHAEVTFMAELASVSQVLSTHMEFLALYERSDTDFIYDRASGLYLIGVHCSHVELRAKLYRYYGGVEPDDFEAADQYILKAMGMFKSRAGNRIYRTAAFPLPPQLRPIYRDMEILD